MYRRVSYQPDIISLVFMYKYVCHIQLEMCMDYPELGTGAWLTRRVCHGDVLTAHGGEKNWVGNLSRLQTWDLDRQIFVSASSLFTHKLPKKSWLLWFLWFAFFNHLEHIFQNLHNEQWKFDSRIIKYTCRLSLITNNIVYLRPWITR